MKKNFLNRFDCFKVWGRPRWKDLFLKSKTTNFCLIHCLKPQPFTQEVPPTVTWFRAALTFKQRHWRENKTKTGEKKAVLHLEQSSNLYDRYTDTLIQVSLMLLWLKQSASFHFCLSYQRPDVNASLHLHWVQWVIIINDKMVLLHPPLW